jgi:hypothetical protein
MQDGTAHKVSRDIKRTRKLVSPGLGFRVLNDAAVTDQIRRDSWQRLRRVDQVHALVVLLQAPDVIGQLGPVNLLLRKIRPDNTKTYDFLLACLKQYVCVETIILKVVI